MTAEQKERARHEVEVEKARQLKRIADALELMAGMAPMSKLVKMADDGVFDRRYIVGANLANEFNKEDSKTYTLHDMFPNYIPNGKKEDLKNE